MATHASTTGAPAGAPSTFDIVASFEDVHAELDAILAVLTVATEEVTTPTLPGRGERMLHAVEFALDKLQADFAAAIDAGIKAARL